MLCSRPSVVVSAIGAATTTTASMANTCLLSLLLLLLMPASLIPAIAAANGFAAPLATTKGHPRPIPPIHGDPGAQIMINDRPSGGSSLVGSGGQIALLQASNYSIADLERHKRQLLQPTRPAAAAVVAATKLHPGEPSAHHAWGRPTRAKRRESGTTTGELKRSRWRRWAPIAIVAGMPTTTVPTATTLSSVANGFRARANGQQAVAASSATNHLHHPEERLATDKASQTRLTALKKKYMTNRAISDRSYYILLAIYALLIAFGTVSNALICLTVILKPKILSPRNIFIVNLAGSDLLLCVFTMPFSFIEISMKTWQMGLVSCKLVAGLQATSIFVSTISITAIALDRYRVIVYPTHQEAASGARGATLLLASVWIGALLLSLPLFHSRTIKNYPSPQPGQNATIDFCIENWPFEHGRGIYSVISMIFQYVLPITIVSIVYAKISDKLQKRLIRRQRVTQLECQQKRQLNLIRRTHTMLVSVSLVFGLSWLPLNLLNVISDFTTSLFQDDNELFRIVFAICHLIGCSSACSNPILYGFLNENFRKEFHQVYQHHMRQLVRHLRRLARACCCNCCCLSKLLGLDRQLDREDPSVADGVGRNNTCPMVATKLGSITADGMAAGYEQQQQQQQHGVLASSESQSSTSDNSEDNEDDDDESIASTSSLATNSSSSEDDSRTQSTEDNGPSMGASAPRRAKTPLGAHKTQVASVAGRMGVSRPLLLASASVWSQQRAERSTLRRASDQVMGAASRNRLACQRRRSSFQQIIAAATNQSAASRRHQQQQQQIPSMGRTMRFCLCISNSASSIESLGAGQLAPDQLDANEPTADDWQRARGHQTGNWRPDSDQSRLTDSLGVGCDSSSSKRRTSAGHSHGHLGAPLESIAANENAEKEAEERHRKRKRRKKAKRRKRRRRGRQGLVAFDCECRCHFVEGDGDADDGGAVGGAGVHDDGDGDDYDEPAGDNNTGGASVIANDASMSALRGPPAATGSQSGKHERKRSICNGARDSISDLRSADANRMGQLSGPSGGSATNWLALAVGWLTTRGAARRAPSGTCVGGGDLEAAQTRTRESAANALGASCGRRVWLRLLSSSVAGDCGAAATTGLGASAGPRQTQQRREQQQQQYPARGPPKLAREPNESIRASGALPGPKAAYHLAAKRPRKRQLNYRNRLEANRWVPTGNGSQVEEVELAERPRHCANCKHNSRPASSNLEARRRRHPKQGDTNGSPMTQQRSAGSRCQLLGARDRGLAPATASSGADLVGSERLATVKGMQEAPLAGRQQPASCKPVTGINIGAAPVGSAMGKPRPKDSGLVSRIPGGSVAAPAPAPGTYYLSIDLSRSRANSDQSLSRTTEQSTSLVVLADEQTVVGGRNSIEADLAQSLGAEAETNLREQQLQHDTQPMGASKLGAHQADHATGAPRCSSGSTSAQQHQCPGPAQVSAAGQLQSQPSGAHWLSASLSSGSLCTCSALTITSSSSCLSNSGGGMASACAPTTVRDAQEAAPAPAGPSGSCSPTTLGTVALASACQLVGSDPPSSGRPSAADWSLLGSQTGPGGSDLSPAGNVGNICGPTDSNKSIQQQQQRLSAGLTNDNQHRPRQDNSNDHQEPETRHQDQRAASDCKTTGAGRRDSSATTGLPMIATTRVLTATTTATTASSCSSTFATNTNTSVTTATTATTYSNTSRSNSSEPLGTCSSSALGSPPASPGSASLPEQDNNRFRSMTWRKSSCESNQTRPVEQKRLHHHQQRLQKQQDLLKSLPAPCQPVASLSSNCNGLQ